MNFINTQIIIMFNNVFISIELNVISSQNSSRVSKCDG